MCESRGGRPGIPVPNKPNGFCGLKAPRKKKRWIPAEGTLVSAELRE